MLSWQVASDWSSDSENDNEHTHHDEWSSSSEEDEELIHPETKRIYHIEHALYNLCGAYDLLKKNGKQISKAKPELPSLDTVLNIMETNKHDERRLRKQLLKHNVTISDLKYYLCDTIISKPFCVADDHVDNEQTETIQQELTHLEECADSTPHQENCIMEKQKVHRGADSFVFNVSTFEHCKLYFRIFLVCSIDPVKEHYDHHWLPTEEYSGICEDTLFTRLLFTFLGKTDEELFGKQSYGLQLQGVPRAILLVLKECNNMSEQVHRTTASTTSANGLPWWFSSFEPFMVAANTDSTEIEKHKQKSQRNKLKRIDKWIYKEHLVVPRHKSIDSAFLLNVTLQISTTATSCPYYIVSQKRHYKDERVEFPLSSHLTLSLIHQFAMSGHTEQMYDAMMQAFNCICC